MGNELTTWAKELTIARREHDDESQVVGVAPEGLDLYRQFYRGSGTSQGYPFTIWTEERVYFPAVYDGYEWIESVPRNPNGEATEHVGGQ